MPHPLVEQLRFTRSEWKRSLTGVQEADAQRRFPPLNSISWNIGHLAWQEQRYWLWYGQGQLLLPQVQEQFASGGPASTPTLAEVWDSWQTITEAADPWLDTLTTAILQEQVEALKKYAVITYGNLLRRVTYHYWYHLGENMALRQLLGHTDLPDFVGNIDDEAPYRPE